MMTEGAVAESSRALNHAQCEGGKLKKGRIAGLTELKLWTAFQGAGGDSATKKPRLGGGEITKRMEKRAACASACKRR